MFTDLHEKRLDSLCNGAVGAMESSRIAIHAIGAAYAAVAEIQPKHGVKQVDRYLSNPGIDLDALLRPWVGFVLGPRRSVLLALDWTEFDDDDHATLAAYVITTHGRATPLAWKTVKKSMLRGKRTAIEHDLVRRLANVISPDVEVELLADRGFSDQKLYALLDSLGWDYTIRCKGNVTVAFGNEAKPVAQWLSASGRATKLKGAAVTRNRTEVGAVITVHQKNMREPWFLVTSNAERTAAATIKAYGRRFTIEETFRDQKDLRFGRGLSATHIRNAARRDRLLMLLAVAQALLTLLGAASERSGLDRYLKVNTVKYRTHSLFRQGSHWYGTLDRMRDDWFERLMTAFEAELIEHLTVPALLKSI